MFTELVPLLAERTVLITVARESDTTLRAMVIPKRAREGAALTTPLSFVGTAAELDRDFGRALAEYVDAHQRLGNTLAQAKAGDGSRGQGRPGRGEAQGRRTEEGQNREPFIGPCSVHSAGSSGKQ